MRIHRGFVYTGVFLVALGGLLVAAQLDAVPAAVAKDTLRLWPLLFIAIGGALILRRTRIGLPAGMLAAAMPGLLLGSGLAYVPHVGDVCVGPDEPAVASLAGGSFVNTSQVSISTGCSTLELHTAPGPNWSFSANDAAARPPRVDSSLRSLDIRSTQHDFDPFVQSREAWDIVLPQMEYDALSLEANAGSADLDLTGAILDRAGLTANAGTITVKAEAAVVRDLDVVVNLGRIDLLLGSSSDISGSLRTHAGVIVVCTPPELGLSVSTDTTAGSLRIAGVEQGRGTWQSANYVTAVHRVTLDARSDFGVIDINPIGGCS